MLEEFYPHPLVPEVLGLSALELYSCHSCLAICDGWWTFDYWSLSRYPIRIILNLKDSTHIALCNPLKRLCDSTNKKLKSVTQRNVPHMNPFTSGNKEHQSQDSLPHTPNSVFCSFFFFLVREFVGIQAGMPASNM